MTAHKLLSIFVTIILLSTFPIAAWSQVEYSPQKITMSLRVGDRGVGVKLLQQKLNSNTATQISESGPGSKGNETEYFGELTKQAVMRFQELHRSEILVKSGLTAPTGFVGPATLAVLNKNQSSIELSTTPSPLLGSQNTQASPAPTTSSKKVILYRSLNYQVAPGETVTFSGYGFDRTNNTVYVGTSVIPKVPSGDGTQLSFTLPSTIELGVHNIWVENSFGSSKEGVKIQIMVTRDPKSAPEVFSVSPQFPSLEGGVITITGTNFTPSGNSLYSSLGVIENLPSPDGKTIAVPLKNFPHAGAVTSSQMKGYTMELWIVVQNSQGAAEKPVLVSVRL